MMFEREKGKLDYLYLPLKKKKKWNVMVNYTC